MTIELSLPIFIDGSDLSAEFNLSDNSRDSDCAGKINHESSVVKISSEGRACFEFPIRLENYEMTTENSVQNEVVETADLSAKQSCTKYVKFVDLYRSDNVRGRLVTQIPDMVSSLRVNGFKPNHPLVVSKKSDGRFLVLVGNRRHEGLEVVANNHLEEFSRVLPGGKVPCIIHEGLTVEEEILIRVDHGAGEDRVKLDDWSQFLAIRQLMQAWPGESEARIAQKLGIIHLKGKNRDKPNRSHVQPRVNLARLPIFVQQQFRLLWEEGKDATPVRVADIKSLYAVFNEEFGKYEDSDEYRGEFGIGPAFRVKWEDLMNPAPEAESSGEIDESDPVDLKAAAAKTRAMGCNSRLVKQMLLAVTNQGGTLPDVDAQAAMYETDSQILADIRAYLGSDDYASLVNDARQGRLDRESAQVEETADVS